MSLHAIRELRLRRVVPQGPLSVVVGEVGPQSRADASVIELKPGCNPATMDWRPVVGLSVMFFLKDPEGVDTMTAAVQAVHDAKGCLGGFTNGDIAAPLCKLTDPSKEWKFNANLKWLWKDLCR